MSCLSRSLKLRARSIEAPYMRTGIFTSPKESEPVHTARIRNIVRPRHERGVNHATPKADVNNFCEGDTIHIMLAAPFFDPNKTYYENWEKGPFNGFADGVVFPTEPARFKYLGY